MSFFYTTSFGPVATPKTIKRLIVAICVTAILSATVQELFDLFNLFPGPQHLLSLSWWGLNQWYLWEPFTFLFIQDSTNGGLTLSFFLLLFFNMYILWVIGTNVIQALSTAAFLRLYFIGGIGAAAITLLTMPLTGQYEMIAGATPALLTIVTVWAMAFPETEVLIFFLIPMKAKWIVSGVSGILLLNALTHWNLSYFVLYLSAIAIGYGYAAIAWGWGSPFPATRSFDDWLTKKGFVIRQRRPRWPQRSKGPSNDKSDKIIDITFAQPIQDDDAFVDAMLTKISKYGESALTLSEKRRLQKISEKKMHDK